MKGSAQSVTVKNTLPKQQFSVYLDNGSNPVWTGEIAKGRGVTTGSFNVPDDEAEHTFAITRAGDAEIQCRGSFTTAKGMVCEIRDEVKAGVQNKFLVDVVSGANVSNCSYSAKNAAGHNVPNVLGCGYNCSGTYLADQNFTMPMNGPVTLTASCQLQGGGSVTCSVVASEVAKPPEATCPATQIRAGHGDNITVPVTVENCGGECDYWFVTPVGTTKGNGKIRTQTSVSLPGSVERTGENTYVFHVENAVGSDECNVVINYGAPTYTCPDDMEAPVGSQVSVEPKNVMACPAATAAATYTCSYTISGGSFADVKGDRYHTGKFPNKIRGETSVSTDDGTEYSLTLTNDMGAGTPCTFKVKYVERSCGCTCANGCNNLKYTGVSGSQTTSACLFATSIESINENYGQNEILVNGSHPGYCTTGAACTNGIEKIDGGYYIEIPKTQGCRKTCTDPNCTGCDWLEVKIGHVPDDKKPDCPID